MKNRFVKAFALVLSLSVVASSLTGCSRQENNNIKKTKEESLISDNDAKTVQTDGDATAVASDAETLVVGYPQFSNEFSPFFAKSSYDMDVAEITGVKLLGQDREGNEVLNGKLGEIRTYNGTDYTYTNISDCEVTEADGDVIYDFTLRKDITFSDGESLTADDVIFTLYVLCDPMYDGSSSIYTLPIKGIDDYRSDMMSLGDFIMESGRENTDFTYFTEEQQNAYWEAVDKAGIRFAQDIVDYCAKEYADDLENCGDDATVLAMWASGYGKMKKNGSFKTIGGNKYSLTEDDVPTAEDFWEEMEANYRTLQKLSDEETVHTDLFTYINEELGEKASEYDVGVVKEDDVDYIEGIEKTGDYSLRITMDTEDATAIYHLGEMIIAPLHYYGSVNDYNYEEHEFGFAKGDLRTIKDKTAIPLGAGPYQFQSYENGVITFEANEHYWKGCPKTEKLLFKEIKEDDKITGVCDGTIDISMPSLSGNVLDLIKKYNGNGELDGEVLRLNAFDNLGYGYIGINADAVKVGDDSSSRKSKKLRKAFATLFAVYREESIDAYYGEKAKIIEYPVSATSWASPSILDEDYKTAYSVDVSGKNIYTDDMYEYDRYEAAMEATIDYLISAGFKFDKDTGKFTEAPDGAKLTYEIMIAAEGKGQHPVYDILTSVKEALADIGITLEIKDFSSQNDLWNALETGTQEMWVAAWSSPLDPEMYDTYHSSNIPGNGGTNGNFYHIIDDELDQKIVKAEKKKDQSYRQTVYKDCFDIILDWGVEVPVYQRQNGVVISMERVNAETITPDITAFWDWKSEIELLEMK